MNEIEQIEKTIPEEVITEATAAFQSGLTLILPYMLAMTPEDRKKLYKMADGTEPLVAKSAEFVQTNPQFVPSYMNVDSMKTGFTVYGQLVPLFNVIGDAYSLVSDTRTFAGAQALKETLKYYDTVKTASNNRVPGAKAIFDELKKRFARKKRKKEEDKSNKGLSVSA